MVGTYIKQVSFTCVASELGSSEIILWKYHSWKVDSTLKSSIEML